ncbi:MAG: hypothetical protein ACW96X_02750 [Promethearchaeota archaeon]|jgi:hypothetical protein
MRLTERNALKEVVKFAKKEFREKRPLTGKVLRVKDIKKVTIGGPLSQHAVKEPHIKNYVVLLDYGENYRVYNFSKTGILMNGETIEKNSDKIKLLLKSTKVEYKL